MIELKDIRPEPLFEQTPPEGTQIWAQARTFEKGKRYLIIAASGKGKSTLLHSIYGLRHDFTGEITFDGQNNQGFSLEQWAEIRQKRLSIIFQDLRLFPQLTALENLQLKLELHPHKDKSQIMEMASRLGVVSLLPKPCGSLSYGQRQRIAIIRALCQPFEFLLLDEPFSHLDKANTEAACRLIDEEVARQKAGFLLVSLGEKYPIPYDAELIL